jgi:phenylpyruvate tautomerase PptA (4-oxalocrotonate tautomerase family)
MPLIRIDLVRGRTQRDVQAINDYIHEAAVDVFEVPARDRHHVVTEHDSSHLIVQDSGLGIVRTRDVVIIQVFTRPHSSDAKQLLYRLITEKLLLHCATAPTDVVITCVTNADEDWSFGFGRSVPHRRAVTRMTADAQARRPRVVWAHVLSSVSPPAFGRRSAPSGAPWCIDLSLMWMHVRITGGFDVSVTP